jgi:hypothetical protein
MHRRKGIVGTLFCFITSLSAFVTWQCQANIVELDWTSSGFSASHVTINAGDEVDIVNYDFDFDLQVTGSPAPNNFNADIPPTDGYNVYYLPYVYSGSGTFTLTDQFSDTVTVTVNAATPLSVAVTAPAGDAVFTAPATFTVTAVPSGGAAPYAQVQFFVGTNQTGVAYSAPFTGTVTNLWPGSYNIRAVVTDNNLNTATNSIQVSVVPLMVTNYIAPVDCGTIYSSGSVLRQGFALTMGTSTEGGLEFAAVNASPYSAILLEISPQGTPVWANTVQVYGIDGRNGTLLGTDYGSGTYLGSFPVPANTPDGQPLLFDVTGFVRSAIGPYFGILIKAGPDLFGSTGDYTSQPPGLFAVGPAPMPRLTATRAGNQMIISWPTNYSGGLTLKTSATLGPGATWNVASPPAVQVGNQWMETNSISTGSRYFRLSSQ